MNRKFRVWLWLLPLLLMLSFPVCGDSKVDPSILQNQEWNYAGYINQDKMYAQNFTFKAENNNGESGWILQGECYWRQYFVGIALNNYRKTIKVQLHKDYTLDYYESNLYQNDQKIRQHTIGFLGDRYEINYHYLYDQPRKLDISTKEPLYYVDEDYPCTLEILLKSHILKPNIDFVCLTGSDKVGTICLKPTKTSENVPAQVIYQLGQTEISTTPQQKIIAVHYSDGSKYELSDKKIAFEDLTPFSGGTFPVKQVIKYLSVVNQLSLKIKGRLYCGDQNPDQVLNNYRQAFKGVITPISNSQDYYIDGVLKVMAKPNQPKQLVPFPVDKIQDEALRPFLATTSTIHPSNNEIINLAKKITNDQTNKWDAIQAIAHWVNSNIAYDFSTPSINGNQTDLQTLKLHQGRCVQFSELMVALCRSVNIPARVVIGYAYINAPLNGPQFDGHAWVEVYLSAKDQWIPVDPTFNEINMVDATHFGGTDIFWLKSGTLEIIDYQPKIDSVF